MMKVQWAIVYGSSYYNGNRVDSLAPIWSDSAKCYGMRSEAQLVANAIKKCRNRDCVVIQLAEVTEET